jgi:hypothetical protein
MSVSISCVLLFALLGVPCISASLVRLASLLPPVKKARACGGGAEKAEANLNPNGDLVGRGAGVAASLVSAHAPLSEAKGSVDAATLLGILTRSSSMVTSSNPMAHRDPLGGQGRHFEGGAIEMVESVSKAVSGREQHEHAPTSSTEDRVIESRDARTIERECIIALIAEHRESEIAGEGGPDATTMRNLFRKQKKTKKKQTTKKKTAWAALGVGFLRKALAGTVLILHPLVANAAFRAVHCVRLPSLEGGGEFVLATDYSKLCFSGEHLPVFILAIATILVCIVGFPIGAVLALGRSIGCCSARAKDDAEVDTAIGGNRWAGPVSGGLCCRCEHCKHALQRSRQAFNVAHSVTNAPMRHHAYAPFTNGTFKPEFFWIRTVFYWSITLFAIANTFLNPDLRGAIDEVGVGASTSTTAMQIVRLVLCALAVSAPSAVLVVLLPNKHGSRWRFPLHLLCTLVSMMMLSLNALSWVTRGTTTPRRSVGTLRTWRPDMALLANATNGTYSAARATNDATLTTVLAALSYAVLIVSWMQLGAMAIFFVIFVVFRGAQLQKKEEDAVAIADAENDLSDAVRVHSEREATRKLLRGWQKVQVEEKALRLAKRGSVQGRIVVTAAKASTGWVKHIDEASGEPYYYNSSSGETTWETPAQLVPRASVGAPPRAPPRPAESVRVLTTEGGAWAEDTSVRSGEASPSHRSVATEQAHEALDAQAQEREDARASLPTQPHHRDVDDMW